MSLTLRTPGGPVDSGRNVQGLIARIIESEKALRDIRARTTCRIPAKDNKLSYEYDWGYEGGKEFYAGWQYLSKTPLRLDMSDKDNIQYYQGTSDEPTVYFVKLAFDGEKLRYLRHDKNQTEVSGRIGGFRPWEFRTVLTPSGLLGFGAKEHGRESLGEALSGAEQTTVGYDPQTVDGHSCLVIEAIGVEKSPSGAVFDARVWIDCERDYRPLRIERYQSIGGKNRWKVLSRRIDNVKLEYINGIWFPVRGERSVYRVTGRRPPKGMPEAQFAALPSEEARELGEYTVEQLSPTRVLTVDPGTVRINQGIPEDEFTIQFPKGCKLWDEFLQLGYIVGRDKHLDAISDALDGEMDQVKAKTKVAGHESATATASRNRQTPESQREGEEAPELTGAVSSDSHAAYMRRIAVGCAAGVLLSAAAWVLVRQRRKSRGR